MSNIRVHRREELLICFVNDDKIIIAGVAIIRSHEAGVAKRRAAPQLELAVYKGFVAMWFGRGRPFHLNLSHSSFLPPALLSRSEPTFIWAGDGEEIFIRGGLQMCCCIEAFLSHPEPRKRLRKMRIQEPEPTENKLSFAALWLPF